MKTKVKRLSKRTLATIMSLLMLISCVTVGVITSADAASYYLWTSTDGSQYSAFSKIGEMSSNSDGTYSGSFTHSGYGNFYFIINTSSTSASTGDVITENFSGMTVTNGNSSIFNDPESQQCWNGSTAVYSVRSSMKSNTARVIYVTYNPTSKTITFSDTGSSDSGSGGGNSGGGSGDDSSVSGSLNAIYFVPNSTSYWRAANARFKAKVTYSDNTTVEDYMTKMPNVVRYVLPLDPSKTASKVKFSRIDPDGETAWNNSNEVSITEGNNLFTQPANTWDSWNPTQSTYTTFDGYLPDVLGGTRIMFYYGDTFKNDDGNHIKYLNNGSSDVTSATSLKRDMYLLKYITFMTILPIILTAMMVLLFRNIAEIRMRLKFLMQLTVTR